MIKTQYIKNSHKKAVYIDGFDFVNLTRHDKHSKWHSLLPSYLKTDGNEKCFNYGNIVFSKFCEGLFVNNELLYEFMDEIDFEAYFIERESLWKNESIKINILNLWNDKKTNGFYLSVDKDGKITKMDYITVRKEIYVKEYMRLIKKLPKYIYLLDKLKRRENIMICERNVPAKDKLGEYSNGCDEKNICDISIDKLELLLNDPNENFGFGLALAYSLLLDLADHLSNQDLYEENRSGVLCNTCWEYQDESNFLTYECNHFNCVECYPRIEKAICPLCRANIKIKANDYFDNNEYANRDISIVKEHSLFNEGYDITNQRENYSILRIMSDWKNTYPNKSYFISRKIKASHIGDFFTEIYECDVTYKLILSYFCDNFFHLYTLKDNAIGNFYDNLHIYYYDIILCKHRLIFDYDKRSLLFMMAECDSINKLHHYRKINVKDEIYNSSQKIKYEHFVLLVLFLKNHIKYKNVVKDTSKSGKPIEIFIKPNDLEHYYLICKYT